MVVISPVEKHLVRGKDNLMRAPDLGCGYREVRCDKVGGGGVESGTLIAFMLGGCVYREGLFGGLIGTGSQSSCGIWINLAVTNMSAGSC